MRALVFSIALVPDVAAADAAFDRCLAVAAQQYEAEVAAIGVPDPVLLSQRDVLVCGGAGIVACDLSEDRVPCQEALAAHQHDLRRAVLDGLPAPGDGDDWAATFYRQFWPIAHGSSAGPDCEGQRPFLVAWCGAVEANRDLAQAFMLWQLAFAMGRAPSGFEAGWVDPPRPPSPQPRP